MKHLFEYNAKNIQKRFKVDTLQNYNKSKYPIKPLTSIINFEIKRDVIGDWYVRRNGIKYIKDSFTEENLDSAITFIKNVIRDQYHIKTQNIKVTKNINDGFVKITIE
jgi:hypothetical protein